MRRVTGLFLVFLVGFLFSGCAYKASISDAVFINKEYDFSTIKRVAILPFENLAEDRSAGEVVRFVVYNEIQKFVETVPPGDVEKILKQKNITKLSEITKEDLKSIAKTLQVDAFITGYVYKYGETRAGSVTVPEVAFSLNIVEPEEGSIIFSVTKSGTGDSFFARHFGMGITTVNELALKLVREALNELKNI